jgi:hypothetical protein
VPRPRRAPDSEGRFRCSKCKELKHITKFYQNKGAAWNIPDPVTGEDRWYGKPLSWCIECVRSQQKAREQADLERAAQLEAQALETGAPVTDPSPPPPADGSFAEPTDEELEALVAWQPQRADEDV